MSRRFPLPAPLLLLAGALLLLSEALRAGEEKSPVAKLPECLRPGAEARFERAAGGGALRADVTWRAEGGEAEGTVRMTFVAKTADLGPLTRAERLVAVLDAKSRRIRSFTFERASGEDADYVPVSRLAPDPKKVGGLVFTRIEVTAKGEKKEHESHRKAPEELWVPEPLEPFLAALLVPGDDGTATLGLMDPATGSLTRVPPVYRRLGKGEKRIGDDDVPCTIWRREQGEKKALVYRRTSDGMPLKDEAARITLRPESRKKTEGR